MATFTVDWEHVHSYLPFNKWNNMNPLIDEPTQYLLDLLERHNVKAIFYVVGWLRFSKPLLFSQIVNAGHTIGDHTWAHDLNDGQPRFEPFRAPRWKGEKRLYSGGFWFRLMPYWWVKREVERTGIFFVHPHDLLETHPDTGNPFRNWMRRVGLGTVRDKMERLMREVDFGKG